MTPGKNSVEEALTPGAHEPDGFDRDLGYEALTEDEGYSVEFPEGGGEFYGTYTGSKELPVADPEGEAKAGRPVTWTMLTFADEKGERCNMPSNYRLNEALTAGLTEGQQVKIVHHGKKDLGGGQTLNRMSVYVKKTA